MLKIFSPIIEDNYNRIKKYFSFKQFEFKKIVFSNNKFTIFIAHSEVDELSNPF